MKQILAANPFAQAAGNRVNAMFLDEPPTKDAITGVRHLNGEEIVVGAREIHVHYPDGMGGSKLVIPAATKGTMRNMNTVAKLAQMSTAMS